MCVQKYRPDSPASVGVKLHLHFIQEAVGTRGSLEGEPEHLPIMHPLTEPPPGVWICMDDFLFQN